MKKYHLLFLYAFLLFSQIFSQDGGGIEPAVNDLKEGASYRGTAADTNDRVAANPATAAKPETTKSTASDSERDRNLFIILSSPSGAIVMIDGSKSGETPLKLDNLAPGEHEITLDKRGFAMIKRTVRVGTGETQNLNLVLSEAAYIKHRRLRRAIFGVLAAGLGATGYCFNLWAEDGLKKLDRIQADYNAATTSFNAYHDSYSKEKDKVEGYNLTRNVLYGVAGVFGAGFAISIPF